MNRCGEGRQVPVPKCGGVKPEAGKYVRAEDAVRIRCDLAILAFRQFVPRHFFLFGADDEIFLHTAALIEV